MDDFHTNNIMVHGTNIAGFIDLEMTRYGNEVLLLGAALSSMCQQSGRWPSFRRGYETARGVAMDDHMLSLIRRAASFSTWIRFTWFWSTDDQPWWATEADLRSSAVRAITETVETIDRIQP
jgi:Ser/Thr protein kinase RdoA (MazF antagonist)